MVRLELFAKDVPGLVTSARQLTGFTGVRGLNVPHKSKDSPPLRALEALQSALPVDALRECVPHYSLKNAYGGSPDAAMKRVCDFCEAYGTFVFVAKYQYGTGSIGE